MLLLTDVDILCLVFLVSTIGVGNCARLGIGKVFHNGEQAKAFGKHMWQLSLEMEHQVYGFYLLRR